MVPLQQRWAEEQQGHGIVTVTTGKGEPTENCHILHCFIASPSCFLLLASPSLSQLSHYLDVVEVSIARQISLRSEAFFHAMSSQHELQDRLTETARAVAVLRGRTAAIERIMCEGPLQALRQALTRSNCARLHNKLKLMAAVHQSQPTVQLLLSTSEFVGALELIATTKEVLQLELQGIHSFRWGGMFVLRTQDRSMHAVGTLV